MAAAYALDATFNAVQLEFEEKLLGRPLYLPSGEFAIFAIVHVGVFAEEGADLATFRLAVTTPYVFGQGPNVVAEDKATVNVHAAYGGDASAAETVSLTVTVNLPFGGVVSVHGLGVNSSVDAVKVTALEVDSVHLTTYHELPPPVPHGPR